MRLYAITGRRLLPGNHTAGLLRAEERAALNALAVQWAAGGVEYLQLREKDLPPENLLALAREIAAAVRGSATRLLVNGPAELALAAAADGVHLPGGWTPAAVEATRAALLRGAPALHTETRNPVISVACHSIAEAHMAQMVAADAVLFAPIFGKLLPADPKAVDAASETHPDVLPGRGLAALEAICRAAAPAPVFALGGVTARNAASCLRAGAAGLAGIRLFQSQDWRQLRGCSNLKEHMPHPKLSNRP